MDIIKIIKILQIIKLKFYPLVFVKLIVSYNTDVKARTKRGIYKSYRVCASWAYVAQGLHRSLIEAKMNTEVNQLVSLFKVVQLGMALLCYKEEEEDKEPR